MNAYVVWGIVLVAVGTILMAYGGHRGSRAEALRALEASEGRYEELSEKVDSLKALGAGEVTQDAISEIDREFQAWASEFNDNRQRVELEFQRRSVEVEQSKLDASKDIRPYLGQFLDALAAGLASYRDASYPGLEYNLPQLPEDVIRDGPRTFEGKVVFTERAAWLIHLRSTPIPVMPLALHLSIGRNKPVDLQYSDDSVSILVNRSDGTVTVAADGVLETALADIPGKVPAEEWNAVVLQLVRTLVEYQLTHMETE